MSQPVIKVKSLEARYGEKVILKDVSFDIKKNEIFVILGGSGCGKSTLLKNIIRLYQPYAGEIDIFGTQVSSLQEDELQDTLKEIGVLFQNGALLNSFTVYENIAIPLEQHTNLPPSLIEKIIFKKLELVDLIHAAHKFPSELSGGMKKRAALARAMVLEPKILFCDEPSAGLDPITCESLDHLLLKLKEILQMTIVVITHELSSIKRIADRVLFLHEGRALFIGTLSQAYQSGIPFVEDFFSKGASAS